MKQAIDVKVGCLFSCRNHVLAPMVGANGLLDFAGEVLMHRLGVNLEHEKKSSVVEDFFVVSRLSRTVVKDDAENNVMAGLVIKFDEDVFSIVIDKAGLTEITVTMVRVLVDDVVTGLLKVSQAEDLIAELGVFEVATMSLPD